jgi:hypothetical protein
MHCETPTRRSLLQIGSPRAAKNSNRYALRVEFPVSYRKQRIEHHSNRYKERPFSASQYLAPERPSSPNFLKINRNITLIESLVSHSKQRTALPINRNISRGYPGRPSLSIFCLPFFAEAKINRKLSCPEPCCLAGEWLELLFARLQSPDSGVESRVKSGGEEFRHGGRSHHV